MLHIGSGRRVSRTGGMAIDFKGMHYPKSVILHAVFFYCSPWRLQPRP